MAKGIREREFQNLMIQWSLPMGWGFTAGRSLPRETTQTVLASHLRDAIVRLNPGVIDGFDVDAVVEEIVATVNAVEGGLVRANEQVLRLLRGQKEFRDHDGVWHALKIIDFEHPDRQHAGRVGRGDHHRPRQDLPPVRPRVLGQRTAAGRCRGEVPDRGIRMGRRRPRDQRRVRHRVPVVLHPQRLRRRLRRAEAAVRRRRRAHEPVGAVPVYRR